MTLRFYDDIQWFYSATGGTPTFAQVAGYTAFDGSADISNYEPEYKDTRSMPSYPINKREQIEFEVDYDDAGSFTSFLDTMEDNLDAQVILVKVKAWGTAPYEAKQGTFSISLNPLDGAAGEALRHTGTLTLIGEWTTGTFDTSTKAFTADVES